MGFDGSIEGEEINYMNMNKYQRVSLLLLRLSLGWLFFYAGITKVLNPMWSAAGYLKGAKSFVWFFQAMLNPSILPIINFVNEWGLLLLGVSLILGAFVRWSVPCGVALMLLYYCALSFPYPNANSLVVDEHIVYIFALIVLAVFQAGHSWGFDEWLAKRGKMTKKA